MKIKLIILISLFITATMEAVQATSDGKGNRYFRGNVGIKERNPQAELHINGSLIMNDDNEATDYILRSDANGLASWVNITSIPGVIGNNGTVSNLTVFNGFLQDATLNGTTTVNGPFYFPGGYTAGHILTMQANGNATWLPNMGPNGGSTNGEWLEIANVLYPADMNGDQSVAIGSQSTATADIILNNTGGAYFNRQRNPNADFIISGSSNQHLLFVDASEDRVAINHGNPDTVLDIKGHFSIRAGTAGGGSLDTDFTTTPDAFSSVFWLAQNSIYGDNGDLMARIHADGQDKIFTVIDFDGTTNGETTQNGLILTDLTANRLVSTDASRKLVSETNIIINANGFVAIGGHTNPDSQLEVGNGVRDHIDGDLDLHVADDIEADGIVYGAAFFGDGSGLELNGNTIRNARIFNSRIYDTLDFNGASMIRAPDGPLLINGNTIFAGDATMQAGYTFRLYAGSPGSEYVSFYSHDGQIGINTETPTTDLDLNGQIAIRGGSPSDGYVLTSDANGLASWQYIDTNNASYAINADNATTANFAENMVNGLILNGTFIDGVINGARLVNVNILSGNGLSEWLDGPDGLYPRDSAGAQNVLIGGTTLASSTISLEANGTARAVKFVGDGSEITGAGSPVWSDQGTYLHPAINPASKDIVIGGNSLITADIILGATGSVVINEQGLDSDFRIEGQTQEYLFFTDASLDRVGIKTANPRTVLDINGSIAYQGQPYEVVATTGIPNTEVYNNSVIYLRNSGSLCNVNITANPQIAPGVDGQVITLVGSYTNEALVLEDGDGVALNNNISFTLKAKDSITLVYSAVFGEWIELSRNNYVERPGETIIRGACS